MNPVNNQQPSMPSSFSSAEAPPPPVQTAPPPAPSGEFSSPSTSFGTPTPAAPQTPPPAPPAEQGTPTVVSGNGSNKKKFLVILGVVLLLIALGVGAYYLATQFLFPSQQATPSPSPVAEEQVTVLCLNIKAYDAQWNRLSLSDLSSLKPGDVVRFTVSGETESGNFDKARFSVNSVSLDETEQRKPDSDEFYDEYIIPEGVSSFSVEAQIHHQQLDQWI